ncbi:MAG: fatty acid desaturase [Alphaproteobacteria bacterium]|nr:fatty acid desaturase [Alphaproteobacteria bacterium]
MLLALSYSYLLTLALAVPAAFILVRLFVLQHDCGHRSFFRSAHANDFVGRLLGVFTLTPYEYWRRTHAMHHAGSGNLERRGVGDITTLTVAEYRALPRWRKLVYRAYRHPLVLFGIGPAYLFLVKHRLPLDLPLRQFGLWRSVLLTNFAILGLLAGLAALIGPMALAMIHLPVVMLASAIGVWMFVIQHQFRDTLWQHKGEWNFGEAALHGSSFYDLPRPLHWLTANIGMHHIHHLCSTIPSYRLPECIKQFPELCSIGRVSLLGSLQSVRLALWDERSAAMVSFRQLRGQ